MRPILISLLAFAGCSSGFDPINYVSTLRLVDVKAEPAEVAPGMATRLTATWANPGKSAPTISWDYCTLQPPPGSGSTTNDACVQMDTAPYLKPIGTGYSVDFTMPDISISQLGYPDATNGFYLPIRLRLSDATQQVKAIFSLRIYPGPPSPNPPNKNPTLMQIQLVPNADAGMTGAPSAVLEGMPPDVHKGDAIDLRALLMPDSQETYTLVSVDPTNGKITTRSVTETVSVTWLATAGEFSNQVTGVAKPDTVWTLDKNVPAAGSTIDLWIVARDERGGSDVMHRTFNLK